MSTPDQDLNSVRRTLRALELLAERSCSQTELARELAVHPRTANRLLGSLVAEGYVARDESSRPKFKATLRLLTLAGHVLSQIDLIAVASPIVSLLAHRARATAHVSVLDGATIVRLIEEVGG